MDMNMLIQSLIVLLTGLVAKFPITATIVMAMGVARAVMKPLFAVLHAYADATPSAKDNEAVAKIEGSKVYKTVSFVLDWVGSIKLPK